MQLNLPILDMLKDSHNILIAGAGGGFDVFAGLPLYFTLREAGKTVHLANYSFAPLELTTFMSSESDIILPGLLVGVRGAVKHSFPYYPEGYLAQWFAETQGENVTVWMFDRTGVVPLAKAYQALIERLHIDALILVDGGVDSLMRGDEIGPGTLVEDSITLAAVANLDLPVKIMTCLGFGTEVEEAVCHYNALENMASLAKAGAFFGSCALTPQMKAFQLYEAACRFVWEQPTHSKSHISTRIIPAVRGEFDNFQMYDEHQGATVFISLLMSLYWFFDASAVIAHSHLIPRISNSSNVQQVVTEAMYLKHAMPQRPRRAIPY